MTIAAITENYSEEQLTGFFPGADIRWVILRKVEAVTGTGIGTGAGMSTGVGTGAEVILDLDFTPEKQRCEALSRLQPALVFVNAVTPTLAEMGYPFVRINGWPGFLERSMHELVAPDEAIALRVAELYTRLGRQYRLVPDEPGMISARILSTIINEAYFTWEEEVSTKEEIDTAMRLGTNYPLGPFEWSERIGPGQIAGLLWSLSRTNPAYVPSKALQRAAEALKYD